MNSINLVGRLVRDPDLRYTQGGTPVCNYTLAVEDNYNDDTDFIDCVSWQKQAEAVAKHMQKGLRVAVSGRLKINKRKKDGRTYYNTSVNVNQIDFLEWPDDNKKSSSQGQVDEVNDMLDEDDFDVPFG